MSTVQTFQIFILLLVLARVGNGMQFKNSLDILVRDIKELPENLKIVGTFPPDGRDEEKFVVIMAAIHLYSQYKNIYKRLRNMNKSDFRGPFISMMIIYVFMYLVYEPTWLWCAMMAMGLFNLFNFAHNTA